MPYTLLLLVTLIVGIGINNKIFIVCKQTR